MLRVLTLLLALSLTASAADLKVLMIGAIEPGFGRVAEQFKKEAGHNIATQNDTAPGLIKRIASGETADILIAPDNVIDEAVKQGKAIAATKTNVAKVGIGIALRRGATVPNVKTADALKQALLSADSIVYNEGSSGLYLEKLFEQMGIAAQLKTKTTRYPNGGQVIQHVINGKGVEIGLVPVPVIISNEGKGIQLAGPLPAEVQNATSYAAVVMTSGKSIDAAKDFIRYLTLPAAKQTFKAAGVD